jgi:hypothetical protein
MKKLTALITGASDGLGKSFALELASRNIDLVLISLPQTGLDNLAKCIRLNFNVEVHCFELDLTQSESFLSIFERLKDSGVVVDILVNNAGLGNWSWFEEKDNNFYKTQIDLNITSTVLLTRLFFDQIEKQQRSYVLNVGSLGSRFIVPKKLVYGATKSFISYFTKCLQIEQSGSNTSISLLSPGGINTKPELLVLNHTLTGISKATILEPDRVARVAINGLFKGKKEIIPGVINKLLVVLDGLLPAALKEIIIRNKLKTLLN